MAPIIEVSEETLRKLDSSCYTLRTDLETKSVESSKQIIEPVAELDKKSWIIIPEEFTSGKYRAEVNPARLTYCPAVEKAGKELGLKPQNTSRDSLGRDFVGNINWFESLKLNLALGVGTPDFNEFRTYGELLYQGMIEEIKVYDVSGKELSADFLRGVFDDIFGIKSPWRAEYIDADFKKGKDGLYINSNHVLDANGNLIPQTSEVLDKSTLMKDKTPGIFLEDYLHSNYTTQGLPKKSVIKGDFYYWYPRSDNNSVAGFGAYSDGAGLDCNGGPSVRDPGRGVRSISIAW